MRSRQTYWLGASKLATSVAVDAAFELERRRGVRRGRGAEHLACTRPDLDRALVDASPTRSRRPAGPGRGAPRSPSGSTAPCRATGRHRRRRRCPGSGATRLARRQHRRRLRTTARRSRPRRRAPRGLVGAAEEDVRGASDPQARAAGLAERARRPRRPSSRAASPCRRACRPRGPTGSRRVGGRRRQVEEHVDGRIGEELVERHRDEAVLCRERLAARGSRSAQATTSNESNARAFSAYCRLITPQPTIPIRAAPIMRPRRRTSAREGAGGRVELEPSDLVLLDEQPVDAAATAAGRRRRIPRRRRRRGSTRLALGRKSLMCTIGERAPARVTSAHRVDAGPPRPAEVELEEQLRHLGEQLLEQRRLAVEAPQLAVVVVEPECEPQGRCGRSGRGEPVADQRSFGGRGSVGRPS